MCELSERKIRMRITQAIEFDHEYICRFSRRCCWPIKSTQRIPCAVNPHNDHDLNLIPRKQHRDIRVREGRAPRVRVELDIATVADERGDVTTKINCVFFSAADRA